METNSPELNAEEKKFILDNYANMTDQIMADHLKKHRMTVMRYRISQNCYKKESKIDQHNHEVLTNPDITEEEKKLINPIEETITPETGAAAEIYKKDGQRTRKDVEKFVPKEHLAAIGKVADKFVMIRKSLNDKEWPIFLSHWVRYLDTYKDLLDVNEDFDDLVGIIRELILQDRLFLQSKDKTLSSTDTKQYNDSVKRQQSFKNALQKRIDERKKNRQLGADAFSDIVRLFDSHKAREAMIEADKADYDELKSFMDRIKDEMAGVLKDQDGGQFDGNEAALMLGIDDEKIKGYVEKSHKILLAEDLTEFEIGKDENEGGDVDGKEPTNPSP